MHLLAQTQVVNEATVDKLLGANFLSLALIALVMVVAMFLLFVFMDYRRQQADSRKQDAFLKVFTDDKSPMVTQQSRVGDAIEMMVSLQSDAIEWHKKHDTKIDTLTADVKERSELDGQAYEEMRDDVTKRVENIEANVNKKIDDVKAEIIKEINDLRAEIDQLIEDKIKCADLDGKLEKVLARLNELALIQAPVNAVTTAQSANVLSDDAAKEAA